jgi:hypothetical protein
MDLKERRRRSLLLSIVCDMEDALDGVSATDLRRLWRSEENPEAMLAELDPWFENFHYHDAHQYKLERLVSQSVCKSALWATFVKHTGGRDHPRPLVVFSLMFGKKTWALTTREPRNAVPFQPKIIIYPKGVGDPVYILPLDALIEENKYV